MLHGVSHGVLSEAAGNGGIMSWDSKPSYPPSAFYTVTLKATEEQRCWWEVAAKERQMARGAFLALAADTYVLFIRALREAHEDYDREVHPERWR